MNNYFQISALITNNTNCVAAYLNNAVHKGLELRPVPFQESTTQIETMQIESTQFETLVYIESITI